MKKTQKRKSVCFYFQVHQPMRLSKFSFFDIDRRKTDYFKGASDHDNKFFIDKVGTKSYFPMNELLLRLLKKYPEFKVSFSISGIALEQFQQYNPEIIKSFQALVKTNKVELLNETYYHSLSWLYSKAEFAQQIRNHRNLIWKLFKKRPRIFRNTELIYNNEIGNFVRRLGFEGILAEGWDYYLQGRSPNYVYEGGSFKLPMDQEEIVRTYAFKDAAPRKIKLLLKNYKLSDDIAFRFSDRSWKEFPLMIEKFANWVDASSGDTINLFMDYETFGEHQWEASGIFKFFERLPEALLEKGMTFRTPSETIDAFDSQGFVDMHNYVSWADMERDLSAWVGNKMQSEALRTTYQIENEVHEAVNMLKSKDEKDKVLSIWRKLQTSDHFYYMSTKYWSDGDIHTYFSPYDTPYDAYINYMNIVNDFMLELKKITSLKRTLIL